MTKNNGLKLTNTESLDTVSTTDWNACANPVGQPFDPFLTHEFLFALEQSGSATPETGWQGTHLLVSDRQDRLLGAMPLYLKSHSRGEFVFDQGWAEAFERAGGHYYPKLLCGVPFTPVPGRRLLLGDSDRQIEVAHLLLEGAMALVDKYGLSSLHVNFIEKQQLSLFDHPDMLHRIGCDFLFENRGFENFGDYLASLSSRKRKTFRKERRKAVEAGLEIVHLTGDRLTEEHWDRFFEFYLDTGSRKWGTPYLTRRFFSLINKSLADRILLIFAFRDKIPVAGALHIVGSDTLYGRYWGASEYHPSLHFELCYYQAIEYAIANKLKYVNGGAQGEHKLARGYLPVSTHSMHYLPDPGFREAVKHFLSGERRYIKTEAGIYREQSPFRQPATDSSLQADNRSPQMETRTYNIDGMTCGGCTSSLEKLLMQEKGIESAKASHEDNNCQITLDPALVSDERIAEITDKAGFEFKGRA